jgi:hypothetical protein
VIGRRTGLAIISCLSLAALMALALSSVVRAAAPGEVLFSRIGGWYILKSASGCVAETRTGNDYLTWKWKKGFGTVGLANSAMSIPPGRYAIGLRIGPPNIFDGTVEAVVARGAANRIDVVFDSPSFAKLVNAGWVEFTLGANKHRVTTEHGMDAIRALTLCNGATHNPFAKAGGGVAG